MHMVRFQKTADFPGSVTHLTVDQLLSLLRIQTLTLFLHTFYKGNRARTTTITTEQQHYSNSRLTAAQPSRQRRPSKYHKRLTAESSCWELSSMRAPYLALGLSLLLLLSLRREEKLLLQPGSCHIKGVAHLMPRLFVVSHFAVVWSRKSKRFFCH